MLIVSTVFLGYVTWTHNQQKLTIGKGDAAASITLRPVPTEHVGESEPSMPISDLHFCGSGVGPGSIGEVLPTSGIPYAESV
jgi:hypothetical protein